MSGQKMTIEQQQFAAEHYEDVLHAFLRCKHLNPDEFEDVCVFAYLDAVSEYLEHEALRAKYSFQIVAYRKMKDALCGHFRYLNRAKRKPNKAVLPLHGILEDPSARNTWNGVSARHYERAEAACQLEMIVPILTGKEKRTIQKRAEGYTGTEIAAQEGVSSSAIYSRVSRARNKARSLCPDFQF